MIKIKTHLSLAFVSGYLVCSIIIFFVADHLLKKNFESQLVDKTRSNCLLVNELLPTNRDSLNVVIDRIGLLIDERITIISPDGTVVADSEVDLANRQLDNHGNRPEVVASRVGPDRFGTATRYSSTVERELLYVAFESTDGNFIRISHRLDYINQQVFKIRFILVLALLLSMFIALFFISRISRYLTRPLLDIIRTTKQIGDGEYDREVVVTTDNEIGELAAAINAMATKLKGNIEILQKTEAIRRDFVANTSHELRTPISSIKGYIETLLGGALEDVQVNRRFLERTLSNIVRLEIIVNDMLDLSRLESDKQTLNLRYFEVHSYLKNVMEEFREKASGKGLQLSYESNLPEGLRVMLDPPQLDKAVINLLDNAIKYTETGAVRVRAEQKDGRFLLTVEDTGPGISEKDRGRIFERFYRVDKARSRELGGSGLGLAIVKHIMEIHKGSVTVDSEVGSGTRFTLAFPLETE